VVLNPLHRLDRAVGVQQDLLDGVIDACSVAVWSTLLTLL
jgi:hypothetical protein